MLKIDKSVGIPEVAYKKKVLEKSLEDTSTLDEDNIASSTTLLKTILFQTFV